MRLAQVVETPRRVGETTKRLEKIEMVVAYLSGATRQGRIGIGYATLRNALVSAAEAPTLEVTDVDRALDRFTSVKGAGSERAKREVLQELFARATSPEQEFLTALLGGELRQGALEGIMYEALAR